MSGPNGNYFFKSGGGSSSATGSGLKNYLTTYKASTGSGASNPGNGDFELGNTTNFSLGNVGTLTNGIPSGTSPTFGSGSSGNLSLAIASTSTLGGLYSMDMISSAATTVSDCVASAAFNIDAEDQGRVLSIKIAYKAQTNPTNGNWSGTSSNSYGLAVWDATNSVFLAVVGAFNFVQSSGVGYATGTVQTSTTTQSMRLIIYNANASTNAITLRTDDWFIGPQVVQGGVPVTDWANYTPTFSAGFGTVVNITFEYRRVGDSVYIRGKATCGTTAASAAGIGLPAGLTISDSAIQSTIQKCGTSSRVGTDNVFDLLALTGGSTSLGLGFGTTRTTNTNVSVLLATGNTFTVDSGPIPVTGWSSNTAMSSDTDTRVVAANYSSPSGSALSGAFNALKFATLVTDTHAAYSTSTGLFTAPVTGWYWVAASIEITGTGVAAATEGLRIVVNGGAIAADAKVIPNTSSPMAYAASAVAYISAGQTAGAQSISGRTSPSFSANQTVSTISISRVSGPAVVAASESVGAAYIDNTGVTLTTAYVTQMYATKLFDTHGAYGASGYYIVPVSGKYEVFASFGTQPSNVAGSTWGINIAAFCGATQFAGGWSPGTGASMTLFASCDGQINCTAGQTLYIQIKCAANAIGYTGYGPNTIGIKRVGN